MEHPRLVKLIADQRYGFHTAHVESFIAAAYKEIADCHFFLTKLPTGLYKIRREVGKDCPKLEIFAPDSYGIWREMADDEFTLPPGSRLRLGRYYEMRLP